MADRTVHFVRANWSGLLVIAVSLSVLGLFIGALATAPTATSSSPDNSAASAATATPTATPAPTDPHNPAAVERYFIQYLNAEREKRGLQPATQRDVLSEMAQAHSEDMADRGYYAHIAPDGTTVRDRYERNGLLPECKLSTRTPNEYYLGAEVIDRTWVYRRVDEYGNDEIVEVETAHGLAKHLLTEWLNSPGHRQVLLLHSVKEVGLGLHITDSNQVYATAEFC